MRILLAHVASLAFLLAACEPVTHSVKISGRANHSFDFQQSQPIYVDISEDASARDVEFRELLVSEMQRQGLNVAEELSEDSLILFFSLDSGSASMMVLPGPPPASGLYQIPRRDQQIKLELYAIRDPRNRPVWQGSLDTKQETFDSLSAPAVSQLVRVMGVNFEGTVPVQLSDSDKPEVGKEELAELREQVQALERQMNERDREKNRWKFYEGPVRCQWQGLTKGDGAGRRLPKWNIPGV